MVLSLISAAAWCFVRLRYHADAPFGGLLDMPLPAARSPLEEAPLAAAAPQALEADSELAPVAQRSRVMSFYALSFMGAGPLGTLLCGYLSKLLGPQMAIVVCGSSMLLVVLVITLTTSIARAEFSPIHETAEAGS